jgi:hypothetical protein
VKQQLDHGRQPPDWRPVMVKAGVSICATNALRGNADASGIGDEQVRHDARVETPFVFARAGKASTS